MSNNYNEFLCCIKNIDNPSLSEWKGDFFLPPCTCNPSTSCSYATSTTQFNYTSTDEIDVATLTNLSSHVVEGRKNNTEIALWLCEKYSLAHLLHQEPEHPLASQTLTSPCSIYESPEFKGKEDLLRKDMSVLYPFSKANFTMRFKRILRHHIKFTIQCSRSRLYQETKKTPPTPSPNTTTNLPFAYFSTAL